MATSKPAMENHRVLPNPFTHPWKRLRLAIVRLRCAVRFSTLRAEISPPYRSHRVRFRTSGITPVGLKITAVRKGPGRPSPRP